MSIIIDDVNDNDPVFNKSSYVAHVMENSNVSTSVATVYATDLDQNENGHVSYKITSGNTGDAFQIDNQTGVVSVKGSINRETLGEYKLTVQAEDGGHPSSRKVGMNGKKKLSSSPSSSTPSRSFHRHQHHPPPVLPSPPPPPK